MLAPVYTRVIVTLPSLRSCLPRYDVTAPGTSSAGGPLDHGGQVAPLDRGRHQLREPVGGGREGGHAQRRQGRRVVPVEVGRALVGQGQQGDDLYPGGRQ